jgi:putative hydrolase
VPPTHGPTSRPPTIADVSDQTSGSGDFFTRMLGDLMNMMRTQGAGRWDLAFQLAQNVATDGVPEGNVDPMERIRLEELQRIADLHVADITGMVTSPATPVSILPTGRAEWARRSLESWLPFLDQIVASASPGAPGEPKPSPDGLTDLLGPTGLEGLGGLTGFDDDDEAPSGLEQMMGQMATLLTPAMIAWQVGSITGHFARTTFGQYDLPLPRSASDELLVVPANLAQFAADWSLPPDDVRMWVCLSETTYHAILSRPHVGDRLTALLLESARSFQPDPRALSERLQGADPADLGDLTSIFGDPSGFGQAADSPDSRRVRAELGAIMSALSGYVEHVTWTAAARVIGSQTQLREALRRRRVERGEGERAAEALFGLRLDQDEIDRGTAFVQGVLDRGGDAELAMLWVVEQNLPTPAEVDAPGLWIERINLFADAPAVQGDAAAEHQPPEGLAADPLEDASEDPEAPPPHDGR